MTIKILLDPGHGAGRAHNRGFVGGDNEGDANYNYCAGHLKPALERKGFIVGITRKKITDDPPLEQRGAMAAGYDLLFSSHSNAMGTPNSGTSGTEIWDSVQRPNRVLADRLCKAISDALNIPNRGVKYRKQSDGRDWYGVLRGSKAKSAMLVEHFFHDNTTDVNKWWRNYKQVAEATAEVLADYYGASQHKEYTAQEFIDYLAPLAQEDYKKSGILPSVTIAQGMVESANGNSELARNANNLFGIKASSPWTGDKYTKSTSEFVSGKYVKVDADFRKYKSWEDSVKDHGEFFKSTPTRVKLYEPVYTAKDWQTAVNALTGTYATSPTYAQTLTKRIKDYGLDKYDSSAVQDEAAEEEKPKHIGVFAEVSADMGSALRIVSQVPNAVFVDISRVDKRYYAKIVQVGGGTKHEKATVHIAGANRYETDKEVTKWINAHK